MKDYWAAPIQFLIFKIIYDSLSPQWVKSSSVYILMKATE